MCYVAGICRSDLLRGGPGKLPGSASFKEPSRHWLALV